MKKINISNIFFKKLLVSFIITIFVLGSCKNDELIIDNPSETSNSTSLVTALVELDSLFNDEGVLIENPNYTGNILFDFCFDFVYPITLSYNNETTVTVTDFNGLIAVLTSSTSTLFINSIAFPFQVEVEVNGTVQIQTIDNETDFIELLLSCTFNDICTCTGEFNPVCVEIQDINGDTFFIQFTNACFAECEGFTSDDFIDCETVNPINQDFDYCFDFVYPISITTYDGITIVISNKNEWENAMFSLNGDFDFIYPFDVILKEDNSVLTINNSTDILDLLIYCVNDDCGCPTEIDLVCVAINGEIQIFDNACFAECAGFYQNDFVNCESTENCENCPIEYVPVCVEVQEFGVNVIKEFHNICFAEYAGFSQNDLIDCPKPTQTNSAEVISVEVTGLENEYIFDVGVLSSDIDCTQYANWWEVLTLNGDLIYRRILTHSHIEQPFVRSGGLINILKNQVVIVRAHMNTSGYGVKTFIGSPSSEFVPFETEQNFACDLETQEPLPEDCAF